MSIPTTGRYRLAAARIRPAIRKRQQQGTLMFRDAKVATRLTVGFGLIILLMAAIAFFGVTRMDALNAQVLDFANKRLPKVEKVGRWEISLLYTARHMRNVTLFSADKVKAEFDAIRAYQKGRDEYLDF